MHTLSVLPKVTAAAAATCALFPQMVVAKPTGPYKPTWESTDNHNASPEWFRDAKFGIYWHWGAFATPQFGTEWYPRNMYNPDTSEYDHHTNTYGPPEEWGYENFIKGDKDLKGNDVQFKPVLASEGGDFDTEEWMKAIKASGAKFAGPVGEHHDGYSLWESKVNEWNSFDMGPNLDLVKLFAGLVRENDMKLVVAMHQAYNVNGFFHYAPRTNDTSLQKLLGQLPRDKSDQLWLDKAVEMLDHVQPDIIWNDFGLDDYGKCINEEYPCAIGEEERLNFLSYYFNQGVNWNKDVVVTYKHDDKGFRNTSAVGDWERGGPSDITRPYWLTDDAISQSSWSYTDGIEYYSSKSMVHSLLDRISKNGNMLLNVSPTAAGILPDGQIEVLHDIGNFLDRHGEAVYGTRAWNIYGEGPNKAGGGAFTAPLTGNSSDVRFTRNKDSDVLYVSVLGWPDDGLVSINNFGSDALVSLDSLQSVELLGDEAGQYVDVEDWKQSKDALEMSLPEQPAESLAYVLKLSFDGGIPVPQPKRGASVFSAAEATGSGVTLGVGDFSKVFMAEAGLEPTDVRFIRVSPETKVTVYANGDFTGDTTDFDAGEHVVDKGSVGSLIIS